MQQRVSRFLCFLIIWSVLISSLVFSRFVENPEINLIPIPETLIFEDGIFRLSENFMVTVDGHHEVRLRRCVERFLKRLAGRTGLFLKQDYLDPTGMPESGEMVIHCSRLGSLRLFEDESYEIKITSSKIAVSAETDIGIMRGLETILQLISADRESYYMPAVSIKDKPRFPWRGLMIDPGRHFLPVEVIKRNLDGMAAVKLNVLHWHLTEDQGFRVECKTFPKLHLIGSDGLYYTQTQIREIIDYAGDRGIRVMPEFDIPGHTTSWLVAYPEFAGGPVPSSVERKWGVKDPVFNPADEDVYRFFDAFFQEMSFLFPDEYIHIGGDENNGKQWDANPDIQAFMKDKKISDNHALQAYFNRRILNILTGYNKKMVGWDEIFQPGLPKDIVIHSWRGREAMIESARKGYQTMLSNGYYIDLIHPAAEHYLNDPIPTDSSLSVEEQRFILGGEATMWGEYVTEETIDSRIWPRTAAIAERFWSPQTVRDVADMYRRLDIIGPQLEEHGLTHQKNYDMMLRRLANGQDISPLKCLTDVIEPLKGYNRGRHRSYTSSSPLTRVVDAANPDSRTARLFLAAVDHFLANEEQREEYEALLRKKLEIWEQNHASLLPIIAKAPILKEIESLSQDLSRISRIGLEALDKIVNNKPAENAWLEENLKTLEQAQTQRGQTELMIIPGIKRLLEDLKIKD